MRLEAGVSRKRHATRSMKASVTTVQGQRLYFSVDHEPGIRRVKRGSRFIYLKPNGQQLRGAHELARIRALAIPPAR